MNRRVVVASMAVAGALTVAFFGCGRASQPASTAAIAPPPPDALVKISENGPVKATVSVWPAAPSMLDLIHLRVDVATAPGISATLELDTELLTAFWQDTWQQAEHRETDGAAVQTKQAGLYAEFAGKQRIPSFRISYVDAGGMARELLTEEIALTIAPPPEGAKTAAMQPPLGALDPRRGAWPRWAWGLLGLSAAGAMAVAWRVLRALRIAKAEQVRISAYDHAKQRLRRLREQGAPDGVTAAHEVLDAWYVELSGIVRRYIEQRFGVRAPELTTEEFLRAARTSSQLPTADQGKLVAFLEACDRVKFAGDRPGAAASLGNLALAEGFVDATAVTAERARPDAEVSR